MRRHGAAGMPHCCLCSHATRVHISEDWRKAVQYTTGTTCIMISLSLHFLSALPVRSRADHASHTSFANCHVFFSEKNGAGLFADSDDVGSYFRVQRLCHAYVHLTTTSCCKFSRSWRLFLDASGRSARQFFSKVSRVLGTRLLLGFSIPSVAFVLQKRF